MAESQISASRLIDKNVADVFEVLTLPANHVALDGSGYVRSVDQGDRITERGQTFRMNMEGPHVGGEYQTDNHVTGYDKDKLLAWQTAPADTDPPGWEWIWTLEEDGPDRTQVTVTYDWSKVTDQDLLDKVSFPLVPQEGLEESLNRLASQAA
ncbi:hypothetical protein KLP28_14970 [Nocardioidaceae bacterium]|nr:hypothetical protein KLP28_14970 [Nocardioidaceae bacterium]